MSYSITQPLPGPDDRLVLKQMKSGMDKQKRDIETYWRAYFGIGMAPFKPTVDKKTGVVYDDNVVLGFPRLLVDKGVSLLFGKTLTFDITDVKPDGEEQVYLNKVWKTNNQGLVLNNLGTNGGLCGHSFLRLVPDALTSPDGEKVPRLINLDPRMITVVLDPLDYENVLEFQLDWNGFDPRTKQENTYQHLFTKMDGFWLIKLQYKGPRDKNWIIIDLTEWNYDWPPIFHCQNLPVPNQFWGLSDLEGGLLDAAKAINYTMSNISRILRFHAHPKTWTTGYVPPSDEELEVGPDDITHLPSPEARIGHLEMQSDLSSSVEFYKRLKEALHECARIPELAVGKLDNVGAISGTALQVLYQPLLEKTDTKKTLYGFMLEQLNRRILELRGYVRTGVDNNWAPIIPSNPSEEASVMLQYRQLGASQDTLLRRVGLDPSREREMRKNDVQTQEGPGVPQPKTGGPSIGGR